MPNHPLAEVFGFPTDNMTPEAARHRNNRLCPFHNSSPNCTKASVENPLGVCSVFGNRGEAVVTCPVRFSQDWLITTDAADFFFPPGSQWTSVSEVRLKDRHGKSAGNIDLVLLSHDAKGRVLDYGALEVQAVYISGNVRTPFQYYMDDPAGRADMDWRGERDYPATDYLSTGRKSLAPQMIFKGGILNAWGRKMAVALSRGLYESLPKLEEANKADADIAWMIYDLRLDPIPNHYAMVPHQTIYTKYHPSWLKIMAAEVGDERDFLTHMRAKLDLSCIGCE